MITYLITLLLTFFLSVAYGLNLKLQACASTFSTTEIVDSITVDRAVTIQAPSTIDPDTKYPVVIALHRHGGTAENFVNSFSDTIETYPFIGVYPQGYNNSWNLDGKDESHADDFAFIDTIVSSIKKIPQLTDSPINIIGYSNGGGYDELVDHDFLSTKDTLSAWASNNHCAHGPDSSLTDYGNIKITYDICDNNTEVVGYLCKECRHGIPNDIEGDKLPLVFNFFDNHRNLSLKFT